jgi:hypothetical protein
MAAAAMHDEAARSQPGFNNLPGITDHRPTIHPQPTNPWETRKGYNPITKKLQV